MEEQFILRVPPSVAERIDRLLGENTSSAEDKSLDLSFSGEDVLSLHLVNKPFLIHFTVTFLGSFKQFMLSYCMPTPLHLWRSLLACLTFHEQISVPFTLIVAAP